jgi:hypothetical protein
MSTNLPAKHTTRTPRRRSKNRSRQLLLLLLLLLLGISLILLCWRFLLPTTVPDNSTTIPISSTPEDDLWLPDAISESEEYILESKFDLR